MKKGRIGTRIEALSRVADVAQVEDTLFRSTSTLGVRRTQLERRALHREEHLVTVLGHRVRLKVAELPDGAHRAKPEFEDLRAVSQATGRSIGDVESLALTAAERDAIASGTPTRALRAVQHLGETS